MKDEALRLALEALEYIRNCETDVSSQTKYGQAEEVIKQALEQPEHSCIACEGNPKGKNNPCNVCGLAQPEPEPRVWIDHRVHALPDCFVMQPDPPHTSPLYTSPPKRAPLTDEQIEALRRSDDLFEDAPMWRLIARAIEAAHGIKGEA